MVIATAYPMAANAGLTGHLFPIDHHLEGPLCPPGVVVEAGWKCIEQNA
jgi:hypothetical protein